MMFSSKFWFFLGLLNLLCCIANTVEYWSILHNSLSLFASVFSFFAVVLCVGMFHTATEYEKDMKEFGGD